MANVVTLNCMRLSRRPYLIAKSSLVSLVPFISFRIQTGIIPLPDHFCPLSFLDLYLASAFLRFFGAGSRMTVRTAAPALLFA